MHPWDELAEGVFRRRYESLDLNIGLVVGGDGALVIDTRASHGQARVLRQDIRKVTSEPVRWVINTHYHWDHVFGNTMFPVSSCGATADAATTSSNTAKSPSRVRWRGWGRRTGRRSRPLRSFHPIMLPTPPHPSTWAAAR